MVSIFWQYQTKWSENEGITFVENDVIIDSSSTISLGAFYTAEVSLHERVGDNGGPL